jgi:nucleoside-diphosphate-sugar epimerase
MEGLAMVRNRRVLVTGASGRIGRHVVRALLAAGYAVRAMSSSPRSDGPPVEWIAMDWSESLDFAPAVEGCDAVLHLGAELHEAARMPRVNVAATRALVAAAGAAGTRHFCFVSSVSVYGSPRTRIVTEASPCVTPDADIRSEYMAEDYLRCYARTKRQGELIVEAAQAPADRVILRPTVVVDDAGILESAAWSLPRKMWRGYRHTHHIHVEDVVGAMLWFLERSFTAQPARTGCETYNLSNDDEADNTYANVWREAHRRTGDARFRCPAHAPGLLDQLKDLAKYRTTEWRYPLGRFRVCGERLRARGYSYAAGIKAARAAAIAALGAK